MEEEHNTVRLTVAQATILFLKNQYISRDGIEVPFFAGCFGIFGHGNLAGIGQALQEYPDFRYYLCRNEQGMVHTAAAYAKVKDRMQTFVCTTSVGPGATNMITAAAGATINRLPVLLLPADTFARRNVAPVLQQLEVEYSQDISVNDAFKPVCRFWDRINRPDQLLMSLPAAMRVLTSPSETGAVCVAMPQDVQTEAFDFPVRFFNKRIWRVPRLRADKSILHDAAALIQQSSRPLLLVGGGAIYSGATDILKAFMDKTGIPEVETQAGKGAVPYNFPGALGAVGTTGTSAANRLAVNSDLIIAVGTRYSDFTTASKTQFQAANVRFININIADFDAQKHFGLAVVGDAKVVLEELLELVSNYQVPPGYRQESLQLQKLWDLEVQRIYDVRLSPLPSQGELIGAVNELSSADAIMVSAAGSVPGDAHKLWRARSTKNYHMEYGYSCMGYEIAGGLGIKMAAPERDVYVVVGDGSFLMMNQEIVTSIQEGFKLIVVLFNNHGFKSIGALSRSLGSSGFGTRYLYPENNQLPGDQTTVSTDNTTKVLPVDLALCCRSYGAIVFDCTTYQDFVDAMEKAKHTDRTTCIHIVNDRYSDIAGHSWWDTPIAEVSTMESVKQARAQWEEKRTKERFFF
eukprot:GILK01004403.1.p1 GENE.GILK01004403.1~~GILK01004403.1.p1  ORF type:complete len:651 (+),score=113.27 GILK01004403.1:55-1953(+)